MKIALTFAFLITTAAAAAAQRAVPGDVVDIVDGRTLVLQTGTGRSVVELQYIEVPAKGRMADTVRDHLRLLAVGKKASYVARLIRNDRTAGVVEINGVDMAGQMLRDGAAWHVPSMLSGQPAGESENYDTLESAARTERRGIWNETDIKPPWLAPEKPAVSSTILAAENVASRKTAAPRNPRLGDTGFLLNGYDPASRTGYLSTSLMGVSMDENPFDQRMAVDISYYYKEDEKFKRTGSFVFTLLVESPKAMFDKDNALVLYGGGSPISMPVGKRSVQTYGGRVIEKLIYRLDRRVIDRLTNNDDAFLKIRNNILVARAGRYWLYSLLQITG